MRILEETPWSPTQYAHTRSLVRDLCRDKRRVEFFGEGFCQSEISDIRFVNKEKKGV
jgi:hypothetical protein